MAVRISLAVGRKQLLAPPVTVVPAFERNVKRCLYRLPVIISRLDIQLRSAANVINIA